MGAKVNKVPVVQYSELHLNNVTLSQSQIIPHVMDQLDLSTV